MTAATSSKTRASPGSRSMRRATTERTLSGLLSPSSSGPAIQCESSHRSAPVSTRWRHNSPSRNGISVGLLGEEAHRPLGHRVDRHTRGRFDEGGDTVVVEPGDEHARDTFQTMQLRERVIERVAYIGACLAVRRDEAAPQRRRGAEPVQQELECWPARPLQIVEQEQHRRVRARIDEQVGRGLEPRGAGILAERETGTTVFFGLGPQEAVRSFCIQVGDADRVRVREQMLERVDDRTERRSAAFAARTEQHRPAVRGGVPRELGREPRLAGTRLPAHENRVPATVLDGIPHAHASCSHSDGRTTNGIAGAVRSGAGSSGPAAPGPASMTSRHRTSNAATGSGNPLSTSGGTVRNGAGPLPRARPRPR